MYEQQIIEDGDPAFGIEGTFQIHNTIYVLTDDADIALTGYLGAMGYIVEQNDHGFGYCATMGHIRTTNEMLDETLDAAGNATKGHSSYIVDTQYRNQPKLKLTDADIHNIIISSASQRRDIGYYNRPHDQMEKIAISRMSGFVKNIVEVDFELWTEFVYEARHYHAQDFIRGMVHWASMHSDKTLRVVKGGDFEKDEIILGNKQFNLKKAQPIPFFGRTYPGLKF
jgi:hypothetical protein